MTKCIFITGTDTDVGKTHVSSLILKALWAERILTCGFKPIASGGLHGTDEGHATSCLKNPDAIALQSHSGLRVPYQVVNPFCFEPAIAPHVAAAEAGVKVSVAQLDHALTQVQQAYPLRMDKIAVGQPDGDAETLHHPQVILSEGAGGWHVPLNEQERLSDWVAGQQMGVILVVGLKLGCINHALLTCEAIANAGLTLLGWVANRPDAHPMSREAATLAYLKSAISAPLIADLSFSSDPEHARLDDSAHSALIRLLR